MRAYSNDRKGDQLVNLIFAPDPISRFQYEKVHEAKKGLPWHYAERILMLQGYAMDLGAADGFTSDENGDGENKIVRRRFALHKKSRPG